MQKVTKNKNQKNLSKVERDDVVVLKSNIAHNDYQMNSRNSFSHSINLWPSKFVHLKSNKSNFGSLVKTFDYIK